MARYTKKSSSYRRKGVRKTRAARRTYRKKGKRTSRSRIQTKRLGSRYPLGQKAIIKLNYIGNGQVTGGGVLGYGSGGTYTLNSLSSPCKNGTTDNRAAKFLPNSFEKYRVTGMSYRIAATLVNTATPVPGYMWFVPFEAGTTTMPGTSAYGDQGEMAQIPGAKFKNLEAWNASGKMAYLKGYVNMKQMRGDGRSAGDDDFTGTVGISGNWTDPLRLWDYSFGWSSINRTPVPTTQAMHYSIRTTYYVEFFSPSMNGIE